MHRTLAATCCLLAFVCLANGCSSASTSTRPVIDIEGKPIAGSVAILEPVTIGGVQQWILIRGRSASAPLLLKIHGGPGQAEMATVQFNRLLEQDFLVVEWDQRGAGKSADVPIASVTMDRIVSDTLELSHHLRERFKQERI